MGEQLLTVKELAKMLAVSERSVFSYIKSEGIPTVKIGSSLRFRRESIEAWLEQREELYKK